MASQNYCVIRAFQLILEQTGGYDFKLNKEGEMKFTADLLGKIARNEFQEEYLDLKEQNLLEDDINDLVESLKKNSHIKWVNLTGNLISDKEAKKLAELNTIK